MIRKTMKIKRRFFARVQLKQFEPIESECEAESEIDLKKENALEASRQLDEFCREEVRKTIELVRGNLVSMSANRVAGKKKAEDVGKDDAVQDLEQDLPPGVIDA